MVYILPMKNTTNKTQHVSGTVAFFLVNKDKRNNALTDPRVKIEGDKVITANAIIIPPRTQKKIMVKIHYPSYKCTEEVLFLPHNVTSASGDKPLVILGAVTTPDKDKFIIDVINHNVTPVRIPKDAFLGTVEKFDRSWLEEPDPINVNTNQAVVTKPVPVISQKELGLALDQIIICDKRTPEEAAQLKAVVVANRSILPTENRVIGKTNIT